MQSLVITSSMAGEEVQVCVPDGQSLLVLEDKTWVWSELQS